MSRVAGLTAGQDFRLAPKINLMMYYSKNSYLVNRFKLVYNTSLHGTYCKSNTFTPDEKAKNSGGLRILHWRLAFKTPY